MATEDDFDVDIYGDGTGVVPGEFETVMQQADLHMHNAEDKHQGKVEPKEEDLPVAAATIKEEVSDNMLGVEAFAPYVDHAEAEPMDQDEVKTPKAEDRDLVDIKTELQENKPSESQTMQEMEPPKPLLKQGKRREVPDNRPIAPTATRALFVSELAWWVTDDEVRGWVNQCDCEDELEELTFSEHKVNGKSKGQVYILLSSVQSATAVKEKIDSFLHSKAYKQVFTATFTNPSLNPFKTLPKDAQQRSESKPNRPNLPNLHSAPVTTEVTPARGNFSGGFRGRGGYNNRSGIPHMGGGGYNSRGGFHNQHHHQQPVPAPQPVPGSYNSTVSYQPQIGRGSAYSGGYNVRGGSMMGGMRDGGGRTAMANPMMSMAMTGVPMGGMANPVMGGMAMRIPQMGASMGMHGMQGVQVTELKAIGNQAAFSQPPVTSRHSTVTGNNNATQATWHGTHTASSGRGMTELPVYRGQSTATRGTNSTTRATWRGNLSARGGRGGRGGHGRYEY